MFSQGLTFGATQGAAPTPAAKPTKTEEKSTCVPVTVRIIQTAAAARTDESADILIHGSEAGLVHIVGVAESVVQQAAMLEFTLNDASGRMKIRHYSSGKGLPEGTVTSGRYVSIIGNLRTTPALHVSAMNLRAVASPDEVSYHMIEVAMATLKLRQAAAGDSLGAKAGLTVSADPGTPTPKKVEQGSTISPMKVDAPAEITPPESVAVQPAAGGDLKSTILAILRKEQDAAGEEGLSLTAFIDKCKAPASKITEVLEGLVEEGEVFTTIDEHHFAIL